MAVLARTLPGWLRSLAAFLFLLQGAVAADSPSEYQVKAVFLFNFSQFVDWPAEAFKSSTEPFIIGVLGADPFGPRLEEAVRGEHIAAHPLVVRRFNNIGEVDDCQILFIDRSETSQLDQILKVLGHRSILTVSEIDGAAQRGVMVEFVTDHNRIRLKIDVDAARAAGLPISSKLLRLADIVTPTNGGRTP
jgi:hypothetical protein